MFSFTVFNIPGSNIEIVNFLQGYIDNEVNFDADDGCHGTCPEYKKTLNYDCREKTYCTRNYLDKRKRRCDGIIRDCGKLPWQMTICPNVCSNFLFAMPFKY